MNHFFHSSIIRAYDIRGIYGKTLNDVDAFFIGNADGRVHLFKGEVFILTRESCFVTEERNFARDIRTVLHNLTHKLDSKGYRRLMIPKPADLHEVVPCKYVVSIGKFFFRN